MPRPTFRDDYTALEQDLIHRLAEIEQSDRNMCADCGGEDCLCCEIYLDRQKWVSPDELFAEAREFDLENYEDIPDEELEEPLAPEPAGRWEGWNWDDGTPEDGPSPRRRDKSTPCDIVGVDGMYHCPYLRSDDDVPGNMYFCRDHCGVGVDD